MKVLLDTNIIIHREASKIYNLDIGQLFNWLDKLKYDKYIHPLTIQELNRYKDQNSLKTMNIKIESYNQLKHQAPLSDAIGNLHCPGQNPVFAAVNGDIAIRQQGVFIAKWKHQGDFVMPGTDSSYQWQGFVPEKENAQMHNPARGFVSSANQMATDSTYPYYLGRAGNFPVYRGYLINKKLSSMNDITVEDMERLQTNNYNVFAEMARPVLLKHLDESKLSADEKKYLQILKAWNLNNDYTETGATVFQALWDSTYHAVYDDEYSKSKLPLYNPQQSTLLETLLKDSAVVFADNINTTDKKETIDDDILTAFQKASKYLATLEKDNKLQWGVYKATAVTHLLKIPGLSRLNLPIGGGTNEINATTGVHGPSWRMVVHLKDNVEAYAVYPGGQSGNPGSKYYDTFIDYWAAGKYYAILFLKKQDVTNNSRIKWHIAFTNG